MRIFLLTLVYFIKDLISGLSGFNPDGGFLALVAGFEGVLLAVAVPISFSMVANISEKFESDLITQRFLEKTEIKYFPAVLMISIVFTVVLACTNQNMRTGNTWRIASYISIALFLSICVLFRYFIKTVKRYITDVQNIVQEFLDSAEKTIEG